MNACHGVLHYVGTRSMRGISTGESNTWSTYLKAAREEISELKAVMCSKFI